MLKRIWGVWKRIAFRIGLVQSRLLLTILYFIVVAPFALVVKTFRDPLNLRCGDPASFFVEKDLHLHMIDDARRQY